MAVNLSSLVSIKENIRKILTYYELNGRAYILDFTSSFRRFESREALLKSLNLDDESTAYEFNESLYNEIA